MSRVRTFRADSLKQALQLVRNELGTEAVVLHTRHITHRRVLPWRRARQEVEVTAGLRAAPDPPSKQQHDQPPAGARPLARKRAGVCRGTKSVPPPDRAATRGPVSRPVNPAGLPTVVRRQRGRSPVQTSAVASVREPSGKKPAAPQRPPNATGGGKPATSRWTDRQTEANVSAAAMGDRLDSIQKMLEHLGKKHRINPGEEIPAELFPLFVDLVEGGLENDLARDLMVRFRQDATSKQVTDPRAAKRLLAAMIEADIRCAEPIKAVSGKRKVVALVGPTGAGKTTSLAKLAAIFRLRENTKIALVSADTYRIAAAEQLRTYAEIIDVPLKVVTSPQEMRRAMDEVAGYDLVLIDTAGRSPLDKLKMQELGSLLAEAEADEVQLVLSLVGSLSSLQTAAEKFAPVGTTSLVLTKLDEATGLGSFLNILGKAALPISYLTTGQDVPHDIEPANAARITRLILGQENAIS